MCRSVCVCVHCRCGWRSISANQVGHERSEWTTCGVCGAVDPSCRLVMQACCYPVRTVCFIISVPPFEQIVFGWYNIWFCLTSTCVSFIPFMLWIYLFFTRTVKLSRTVLNATHVINFCCISKRNDSCLKKKCGQQVFKRVFCNSPDIALKLVIVEVVKFLMKTSSDLQFHACRLTWIHSVEVAITNTVGWILGSTVHAASSLSCCDIWT